MKSGRTLIVERRVRDSRIDFVWSACWRGGAPLRIGWEGSGRDWHAMLPEAFAARGRFVASAGAWCLADCGPLQLSLFDLRTRRRIHRSRIDTPNWALSNVLLGRRGAIVLVEFRSWRERLRVLDSRGTRVVAQDADRRLASIRVVRNTLHWTYVDDSAPPHDSRAPLHGAPH